MNVVASFKFGVYLELAIDSLEQHGIVRDRILAIPLEQRKGERKLYDTIHHSDGTSMYDLAFVLAAVFSVPGICYGFIADWGPVIWGLISAAAGILLGLVIRMRINKARAARQERVQAAAEVLLIVECEDRQLQMTEQILWEHKALAMALVGVKGIPL